LPVRVYLPKWDAPALFSYVSTIVLSQIPISNLVVRCSKYLVNWYNNRNLLVECS
jgi:hypothetical protein